MDLIESQVDALIAISSVLFLVQEYTKIDNKADKVIRDAAFN